MIGSALTGNGRKGSEVGMKDIYDSPIFEQIGELKMMMAEEHDKTILKAVQQIGIEIDQQSLVEAIGNDRKWYEEAYRKGYLDCEERYKELITEIICKLSTAIT